jgi:hypothetical protein
MSLNLACRKIRGVQWDAVKKPRPQRTMRPRVTAERIWNPNVKERLEVVYHKGHSSPCPCIAKQRNLKAPIAQLGLGDAISTAFGTLIAVIVRSCNKRVARKKILTLELEVRSFGVHTPGGHLEHVCSKNGGEKPRVNFFQAKRPYLSKMTQRILNPNSSHFF